MAYMLYDLFTESVQSRQVSRESEYISGARAGGGQTRGETEGKEWGVTDPGFRVSL